MSAHELGCVLAVSSGRPFGMVPRSVRRLGLIDYYLCSNGASLHDATGTLLAAKTMPRPGLQALMDALGPLGARWSVFADGRGCAERPGMRHIAHGAASKLGHLPPPGPGALRWLLFGGIHHLLGERGKRPVRSVAPFVARHEQFEKVGCSLPSRQACAQAVRLVEKLGAFEVAAAWPGELEITAAGATKGAAALWLTERLGEEVGRTVAFGDSANDEPLVGRVGRLVAVANASEGLKAVADEVCGPLDEDGVGIWIGERIAEAKEGVR